MPTSARSNTASATKSRSLTASRLLSNVPGEAEVGRVADRIDRQRRTGQRTGAERRHVETRRAWRAAGRRRGRAPSRGRAGDGRAAPAEPAGDGCSRAGRCRRRSSARSSSTCCRPRMRTGDLEELPLAPQPEIGGDLIVAAARGVELAAGRPRQLGDPTFDRGVDVLVALDEHERVRRPSRGATWSSASSTASRSVVGEQPDAGEAPDVRLRAGDVVAPHRAGRTAG